MKKQIEGLMNTVNRCMGINTKANDLLVNNYCSAFDKSELCMIAELSANEAMRARRDARKIVSDCEKDLEEMKKIIEGENK